MERASGTFAPAPVRSRLGEFAGIGGLEVIRECAFSYPAKILTPSDDVLVPLVAGGALRDLRGRSGIKGVITSPELAADVPSELGLAVAPDPMAAHHLIHVALAQMEGRLWTDFDTEIDPTASIHPLAYVAPRNVRIGPDASILPFAVVHERSTIGAGTRLHAHTVIGADAYEIVTINGIQVLRPQTGAVEVGSDCQILSGSVITKTAFCGATLIGDHTVLDCNVTVSHDVQIGTNVRIGGSSWIGGRATIGNKASIGPGCTIGNGVKVGHRGKVSLGSVVTRDVPEDGHVSGNFAIEHQKFITFLRTVR